MILVRVSGVALDPSRQYVIMLKPVDREPGDGPILPIWIGEQEATSILVAIEGAEVPRPLAHDLMRTLLETLGAQVENVAITRIEDGTFYAEITLSTERGERVVDSRPSDAIALASRVQVPIWVAEEVMADAGIPDPVLDESDAPAEREAEFGPQGPVTAEDAADSLAEFQRFLDDVDPDDFRA